MIEKPRPYDGPEKYIFASYSHCDAEAVYEDIAYLQLRGMRIWYDEGLPAGVDWDQAVYPKITSDQCAGIIFFVSPSFFSSRSIAKEIEIAFNTEGLEQRAKESFSVHIGGLTTLEMMQEALSEASRNVLHENIRLIMNCFSEKRTFIKREMNITRSYYNEILVNARRYGAIDAECEKGLLERKESFKVLYVAKESNFSSAILAGIREFFAEIDHVNLTCSLVRTSDVKDAERQLLQVLDNNAQDVDGIILRPVFDVSKKLRLKLEELVSMGKKIVLVDKDLSEEQKVEFSVPLPLFVASDFMKGGQMLGASISRLSSLLPENASKIILLDGPWNIPSAQERLNAMKRELQSNNKEVITTSIILESFDTQRTVEMLELRFGEWLKNEDRGLENQTLFIFFGNDSIALAVSKTYHTDSSSNIRKYFDSANNVVFIGYDGIQGHDGQIALSSIPADFMTVNVIPAVQGRETGRLMLDFLTKPNIENGILISPQLIESVSTKMKVRKSKTVNPELIAHKKLLIFDLDGTIADTESLHWDSYNVILGDFGITLDGEVVKRYIGNTEQVIWGKIAEDYEIEFDLDSFMKRRTEIVLQLIEERDLQPFTYFRQVLEQHKDSSKFILSSQIPEVISYLLKRWKIDHIFTPDKIVSVHDGRFSKRNVLDDLGSYVAIEEEYARSEMVIFEDSDRVLKMASEFGIEGIGVEHKYNVGTLENCIHIINDRACNGLFVGLAGMDIVHYQDHAPPEEDCKSRTDDFNVYVGGPAANAAITFARLGGSPTLVCGIGDSITGKAVKNMLETYGVHVVDVLKGKDTPPNISSIVVNTANGSRTIVSGQRTLDSRDIILDQSIATSMDFCLYDCNAPGIYQSLVPILKGIPVILDAGSFKEHLREHLHAADEVVSSSAFRMDGKSVVDLASSYEWDFAAITHGGEPIQYVDKNGYGKISPPLVCHVVDTLGAGDVLHGAYCYFRFAEKKSFLDALSSASEMASESIRHRGVVWG